MLAPNTRAGQYIDITYSIGMQPLIEVSVGGQWLKLVFDASSGNTVVFVKEAHACNPDTTPPTPCYSFDKANKSGTVSICDENRKIDCDTGQGLRYPCNVPLHVDNLTDLPAKDDQLIIDGLQYNQKGVEGTDSVLLKVRDGSTSSTIPFPSSPIRLLVAPMRVLNSEDDKKIVLPLFNQTSGLFGASGPSLSCRNGSIWGALLKSKNVRLIIFDWYPPKKESNPFWGNKRSRVYFDNVDANYAQQLVWSQPKQSGDVFNDGMYEFLLYRPKVCGIDLLYNTSSNWLAVIDTSGPCLTLPSFLFDRFRSRVPLTCPFKQGERSYGQLCSPDRGGKTKAKLPSLSFNLDDAQEQDLPLSRVLPLERLVFKSDADNGEEKLCVARADDDSARSTADMIFTHVAFGSLAVAAFYIVVNLENRSTGLASRGKDSESSDDLCVESVQCTSPMQTYFPPRNLCEDPPCSDYIFMRLDEQSKMCLWSPVVPVCFVLLLVSLAVLDLLSHKLYKQAIQKAREYNQ